MFVECTVNGEPVSEDVEPRLLLVDLLRRRLGLTGTHIGCETSACGACTVLLDGMAVKSCTMLALQATGRQVTTVEGVAGDELHAVQLGMWHRHGLQCGFCTPGVVMTAVALLDADPDPSEETIRAALSGNLCRCTGYQNIVAAIQYAAAVAQGQDPPPAEWDASAP
jgi:carbon-monoxide dehydrogenase small subunit